jgi:hypothetical protein
VGILVGLIGCVLDHVIGFIDFTLAVDTNTTSFFQLWQVSRIWPILLQLVHLDVDLIVTCITGLDILSLAFGVVRS